MPTIKFGDCTIDTDKRELWVRGHLVEVQPLVLSTLAYLARHSGRVVERDELLAAVWRSPVVADSAVARVIMKARRAVQDDPAQPAIVLTVRGSGYRLGVPTETVTPTEEPLPRDVATDRPILAILPFVNASMREDLAWIEQGLTCLLHLRLGSLRNVQLVPLAAVFAWRGGEGLETSQLLAQACRQLGATVGLSCVLRRAGGGIRLDSIWGSGISEHRQRHWIGSDPVQLVSDLISVLTGEFSEGLETASDHTYWQGQLARAFAFECKAQHQQALALLEACMERLPRSASMLIVHSRLLRARANPAQAFESARQALELAVASDLADDTVACHVELARVHTDLGDPAQAEAECVAAMQLVTAGGASLGSLSLALAARADVLHYFGRADEGVVVAERAAATAAAVGDPYGELWARHLLGKLLTIVPAVGRAKEVLTRVVEECGRRGFLQLEVDARITLGTAFNLARRFAASIESAERARVLAVALGDERLRLRAIATRLFSVIESGALDEAARSLAALDLEDSSRMPVWISMTIERTRAHLAQRQGRAAEAIDRLTRVRIEAEKQGWYNRWSVCARLCHLYLETGQQARAEAMVAELAKGAAPMRLARARAALAMAAGDRRRALGLLRAAWATEPINDAYGQDVTLDLAWMLIEDEADAELDFVMAHVLDMSPEHAPTALVRWVYAARRGEHGSEVVRWEDLAPSLEQLWRRVPWLRTAAHDHQFNLSGGRRLPLLLSSACE